MADGTTTMWNHLERDSAGGEQLDLYECCGRFMIRVGGWELMNGEQHGSEDELGRLAAMIATDVSPRILVGGLGLGFTLLALTAALGDRPASITVVERSAAVLRWFGTINPSFAASPPHGVCLEQGDVLAYLDADRGWDVVVLDVDNGPVALSSAGNAWLYGLEGLTRLRDSLAPAGHALLWSGFEDADFGVRAATAGLSVTFRAVPFAARPDQVHILYVLSRRALTTAVGAPPRTPLGPAAPDPPD